MQALSLSRFFETEVQERRALDAVATEAWLAPGTNLDLYSASQIAFHPSSDAEDAFRNFVKIYDELAGPWKAFRPSSPKDCWPPQTIFATLKSDFSEFSWANPVNLLNFPGCASGTLESSLAKMQGIKPKTDYPTMTVSKFLHFYNPCLFPIYDTEVIWKKVFSRFSTDYRDFCKTANIFYGNINGADTPAFLRNYMLWGSSLLSSSHPGFMRTFVAWLSEQPGTKLAERKFDAATLFATAFEYVAIGAATIFR